MNPNEARGRWLLARGWVSREVLAAVWAEVEARPNGDLGAHLVERGELTAAQRRFLEDDLALNAASATGGAPGRPAHPPDSGLRRSATLDLRASGSGELEPHSSDSSLRRSATLDLRASGSGELEPHPARRAPTVDLRASGDGPVPRPAGDPAGAPPLRTATEKLPVVEGAAPVEGSGTPLIRPPSLVDSGDQVSTVRMLSPARSAAPNHSRAPNRSAAPNRSSAPDRSGFIPGASASGDGPMRFEPAAGRRFRGFVLGDEVSRGAMGAVFRARSLEDGQERAVKFMLNPTAEETVRFEREVAGLIGLKHPNIVEIFDFGVEDGLPFFVMELVEGTSLHGYVREAVRVSGRPPAWRELLPVLRDVVRALDYCHARGILHRDLKPQNILVEAGTRRAVLVDFGLAKQTDDAGNSESDGLTNTGEIVGTPAFMAPEQFVPDGEWGRIGPATDIWGFGATAFHCFTGRPVFRQTTVVEIFQAMKSEPVPRLTAIAAELPEWLAGLVDQCLIKPAGERPSIGELRVALEREHRRAVQSRHLTVPALLSLAGLLALLATIAISPPSSEPVQLLEANLGDPDSSLTARRHVLVRGRVSRPFAAVRINDAVLATDGRGRFERAVPVRELRSELHIRAVDGDAGAKTLTIQRDGTPPELVFEVAPDEDGVRALPDSRLVVTVKDRALRDVTLDGRPGQIGTNGRVAFAIEDLETEQSLVLEARDAAGHRANETVRLRTPKALAAIERADRQRALAASRARLLEVARRELRRGDEPPEAIDRLWPLLSLELWQAASPVEQRRALAMLGPSRDPNFRRIVLPGFDTPAAFRHIPTGIDIVLVPGGERTQRWYTGPAFRRSMLLLRVVVAGRFSLGLFEALLKDAPIGYWLRTEGRQIWRAPKLTPEIMADAVARDPVLRNQVKASAAAALQNFERTLLRKTTTELVMPFFITRFEVSRGEFAKLAKKRNRQNPTAPLQSIVFIRPSEIGALDPFRLPTLTEWQHACITGGQADSPDPREAPASCWYLGNSPPELKTADSRAHADHANRLGLADMLGGVGELCLDDQKRREQLGLPAPGRTLLLCGGDLRTPLHLLTPENVFACTPLGELPANQSSGCGLRLVLDLR